AALGERREAEAEIEIALRGVEAQAPQLERAVLDGHAETDALEREATARFDVGAIEIEFGVDARQLLYRYRCVRDDTVTGIWLRRYRGTGRLCAVLRVSALISYLPLPPVSMAVLRKSGRAGKGSPSISPSSAILAPLSDR